MKVQGFNLQFKSGLNQLRLSHKAITCVTLCEGNMYVSSTHAQSTLSI